MYTLNALGGDWNVYGGSYKIDTSSKTLALTPPTGNGAISNWFFTDFSNWQLSGSGGNMCADLTPFEALEFEALAPAGFQFSIFFTARQDGNCSADGQLSSSHPFTKYYTVPGFKQIVRIPFQDFSISTNGTYFNFGWIKTLFFQNIYGAHENDSLVISNVWLRGRQSCSTSFPTPSDSPHYEDSTNTMRHNVVVGGIIALILVCVILAGSWFYYKNKRGKAKAKGGSHEMQAATRNTGSAGKIPRASVAVGEVSPLPWASAGVEQPNRPDVAPPPPVLKEHAGAGK
ncbi:hypothetical protein HDV00_010766 [Rhizophlyctis rosea]|nr:hypothetical protein HDV00_010766 [Rhizophlyctis rosea]